MAHVGGDEADGAVKVLAVILAGKGFHPSLRLGFCDKALAWPVRTILIPTALAWDSLGIPLNSLL